MFWADKVAQELKKRNLPLEWVDDMKTPSGRIHVGSLFGVVFHDLVFRALQDQGEKAKYTYVFENHDPMDDIPSYLAREKFEKYLGMPLFNVPSPVDGYKDYATYYANEFQQTFNALGSFPQILWTKDLYTSGKMNKGVKLVLDNAEKIRDIYRKMYKKDIAADWYPFQVYCESCGKVSTTRVYNWDGEYVYYRCPVDATDWTKGCGYEGKVSPFSDESGMKGKMPWKVEWPVKWQAIGVTVEGAGKDHMSRGGSHDLATKVAEQVLQYPVPYPISYEFMLIGGKKMSSSKGRGFAAADMLTILPPELVRFLIVKMDIRQQTNFDPAEKDTIPRLFDEYQKAAQAYFEKGDEDLARTFELSQIARPPTSSLAGEVGRGEIKTPPNIRFSMLAQWVQMPNMEEEIKQQGLEEWAKYARVWIEKYAPESEKFILQKSLPEQAKKLSDLQKKYLEMVVSHLDQVEDPEELQKQLYEWAKEQGVSSKDAFSAIYLTLIGKNHGPKAGWLILSAKDLAKKRFEEVVQYSSSESGVDGGVEKSYIDSSRPASPAGRRATLARTINNVSVDIFSIAPEVSDKFPSVTIGVAVIKNVHVEKENSELEQEKEKLLSSLESLATEQLGQYPEIISYRRLYKAMGVDWHSRRPSPEALLRRIALKKGLYTVNTCVDAYNLVVMKHRVSVGAFDLDTIQFPTEFRFAKEGEEILLLGDSEPTNYKSTELAYFDRVGGYNIDFNYRDSQRTAVQLKTKNLYINVDGVYDISSEKVEEVLRASCDEIIKYCGGTLEDFGIVTAS